MVSIKATMRDMDAARALVKLAGVGVLEGYPGEVLAV
jgi:hypothetical protein